MTPIDTALSPSLDQNDPALRAAALNSLGVSGELTSTELRAALLKRLEEDQFMPEDSTSAALLLLSNVALPSSQFAEIVEAVALAELQNLRDHFVEWSPQERRSSWEKLQSSVPFVPYLARQLKGLEPGLDCTLPEPDAISTTKYQLTEQALTQFASSPKRRCAARIEFFSRMSATSPGWEDSIENVLEQQWKLFQLVPDFERELRVAQYATKQANAPLTPHPSWSSTTRPAKSSPSSGLGNWPWRVVAFVVLSTVLKLTVGSLNSSPANRPPIRPPPNITMPRDVTVNTTTQLKNLGINVSDLVLGNRLGAWPSEETKSDRVQLGRFLHQRLSAYRKPGELVLSREQALMEAKILETLLEKYDQLDDHRKPIPFIEASIDVLRMFSRRLNDSLESNSQEFRFHLPPKQSEDTRPQEALEQLLGRKAPVINGVDLAERLDLTNELRDPQKVGERLRARAEAYRTNPVVKLTPVQLKRELQQLEHLLGAYAEHLGKQVDFPEETKQAARSLQIIGVQLQTALEKSKDAKSKPRIEDAPNKESER